MTGSLDGVSAKIKRAEENINQLNAEIESFLRDNQTPYTVVGQLQPNATEYIFTVRGELNVPVRFSVLAGEVVHQLRSSLDHLAHSLVVQHIRSEPAWNTAFPIGINKKEYKKACERRLKQSVSSTAADLILSVQPYIVSKVPEESTLWTLHQMNNRDKHRLLLVSAGGIGLVHEVTIDTHAPPPIGSQYSGPVIDSIFPQEEPSPVTKDGIELMRIILGEPYPGFQAYGKTTAQIIVEVPNKPGTYRPLIPLLTQMLKLTRRIVGSFKNEF